MAYTAKQALVRGGRHLPDGGPAFAPGQPLWQIVPTRDEHGRRVTDFMMLVPRLKEQPKIYIEMAMRHIQRVLARYDEVVFADLNLQFNLLWVSLKHRPGHPGLILEIAGRIRLMVPEAVLVAQNPSVR